MHLHFFLTGYGNAQHCQIIKAVAQDSGIDPECDANPFFA
jgi:hypothetical protein